MCGFHCGAEAAYRRTAVDGRGRGVARRPRRNERRLTSERARAPDSPAPRWPSHADGDGVGVNNTTSGAGFNYTRA